VATIATVSIVGNVFLYNRYSSHRALIDVNDQVIRQKDLQDRLDYLYSDNILRQMIFTDLIMQEAAKEGVIPTDQDVQQAQDELERAHPTVVSDARQSDPTLTLFDEQLKAKLALRNLEIKNVTVTEPEIEQYYSQHQSDFMLPAQTSSSVVLAKTAIAADSAQQMLQNGVDLNVIAQQPNTGVVGINTTNLSNVPGNIISQVLEMNVGDVKTFQIGPIWMIVRSNAVSPPGVPALAVIHDQVALAARQAKGPGDQAELTKLVQEAHITVESDKYLGAVPTVGTQISEAQ
jgi:hypothetical protein